MTTIEKNLENFKKDKKIISQGNRWLEGLGFEEEEMLMMPASLHFYDHVRTYLTEDGKIVVTVSPYGNYGESTTQEAHKNGFTKTDPLYDKNAVSFYKTMTLDEFRAAYSK